MPASTTMDDVKPTKLIGSSRFALTLVMMMGLSLFYATRIDMSVAILCMVNHTAIRQMETAVERSNSNLTQDDMLAFEAVNAKCPRATARMSNENGTSYSEDGPFVWDGFVQNQILGAFFFGYPGLQIAGGWLADSLGGRWVVFVSMLSLAVFTILLPFVAASWHAVTAFRAILGLVSGAVCPAIQAMIGEWAPPLERSSVGTIAFSGLQLGNMFALPLSGLLCRYFNWQTVFFVWGGLTAVWLIPWFLFGYNTPSRHPRIDPAEKNYITQSIRVASGGKRNLNTSVKRMDLRSMPWLEFFKSPAVWACFIGHFAGDWAAYTFLSQTPRYMKSVHQFDITSNSLISALPYLGYWFVIVASGPFADMLQQRKWLSTQWTRRVLAITGYMIPAGLLILLGYLPCEYWQFALVVLVFIISTAGLQYATWPITFFDIAPRYAGVLFGISNTIACTSGIATNAIASFVMSANPTLSEWRLLFFVTAGVTAIGCFAYCFLVKSEVQTWATVNKNKSVGDMEEVVPLRVTRLTHYLSI